VYKNVCYFYIVSVTPSSERVVHMLVAVRSFVYVSTMNIVLRVVFRVANAPEVSALCKSCAISVPWKTIFASLYQKWRKFS